MTERERSERHDEDDYWGHDVFLGELQLGRETSAVRLRVHVADEPYHLREALFPLAHPTGARTYVHAQPYVLEPQIALSVGLYPTPDRTGAIGEVVDTAWEGMRHRDIGNAQAWYYPADRVMVLWECFLTDAVRQDDPLADPTLATVWTGFERILLERFAGVERIATPSWEHLYERPAWQQFLSGQGYGPDSPGCFVKELSG